MDTRLLKGVYIRRKAVCYASPSEGYTLSQLGELCMRNAHPLVGYVLNAFLGGLSALSLVWRVACVPWRAMHLPLSCHAPRLEGYAPPSGGDDVSKAVPQAKPE